MGCLTCPRPTRPLNSRLPITRGMNLRSSTVRSWLGNGHERFSDDLIARVARTMPYPTAAKVGARVWALADFDGEDAYEAHEAGYIDPEVEDAEAISEGCSGCGATKSDDGWTWHPSDCPKVAVSPEAQARIDEIIEDVERKVIRVR